ncbi:MAG: hypothetical protein Q7R43_05650 [Candidatus Daviesbacteria bacterium]|nr:hypothetical protein [Candidatus Daviesbacteria bacterium]
MVELTDRIIKIRPFTLENAEEHLAGEDEAQVKWLSDGKGTLEGVQKWIQKISLIGNKMVQFSTLQFLIMKID